MLDYDRQWAAVPGYWFYDFHAPENLPTSLLGAFDMVRSLWFVVSYCAWALIRPLSALVNHGVRLLHLICCESRALFRS